MELHSLNEDSSLGQEMRNNLAATFERWRAAVQGIIELHNQDVPPGLFPTRNKFQQEFSDTIGGFPVPMFEARLSNLQNPALNSAIKDGEILLSGIQKIRPSGHYPKEIIIQHSAYTKGNNWKLRVKCKQLGDSSTEWKDLLETFPDATIEERPTCVVIRIPSKSMNCPTSFVVVGSCSEGFKRMQVIAYGTKPTSKNGCEINAYLIDDNQNALKVMHENEKKRGRRLLGQLRLLYVANTEKPIEFSLQFNNSGWKVRDSDIKTIDSDQAWRFWEKYPNLEHCSWTLEHHDKTERHLRCSIFVTQGEKSTFLSIHEYLQEEIGYSLGKEEVKKEGKEKLVNYQEKCNKFVEQQKAQELTLAPQQIFTKMERIPSLEQNGQTDVFSV